MSPNAEKERIITLTSATSRSHSGLGSCHGSASSLDSNDRGRSIAKGGVTTPFPWKLHIMLDAMGKSGDKSIVCWQPHGRAFMVHKPKDFVQQVMPHFFNQTKYASFQRQLNLYGFSRLTHGPDKGAYYHNCFVRGKRHLCKGMIRQKIKGTKVRKSLSPEDEPNFYDIEAQAQIANPCVNVRQESNTTFSQSSSSPQSNGVNSPIAAKVMSSEESLVSLVPSTNLDPFDTSNSMSRNKVPTRMNTPTNSHDSNAIEPVPSQSTSLSTSRIVSPQHYSDAWSIYDEVKAGDLLFFEGQPFRYLEHFEEVPANQQSPLKIIDSDNSNNGKLLSVQLSKKTMRQRPHATREIATTDVFQDRISKIYFNYDSTRSFQSDLMQNTSCPA